MHWNHIENEWIAMTRRIRSDRKDGPRRTPWPRSNDLAVSGNPPHDRRTDLNTTDTNNGHVRQPTTP